MEPTKHPMFPIIMSMASAIFAKIMPDIVNLIEDGISEHEGDCAHFNEADIDYKIEDALDNLQSPELYSLLESAMYSGYERRAMLQFLTKAIKDEDSDDLVNALRREGMS